jgi:hypothetical protein
MKTMDSMREKGQLISVIVVSLIAAVLIIGASLKKKPKIVVVEATAEQMFSADTIEKATANDEVVEYEHYPQIDKVFHAGGKIDLLTGNKLYSVCRDDAGWTDPTTSYFDTFAMDLACMVYDEDVAVIGGDKLIFAAYDHIELYDEFDLGSPINVILKFGEGYLVGANDGLHFIDQWYADTLLKENILVTALAEDKDGLWIGTFGDGLWRYDGEKWQRRYLFRDNSIFDFVTALEYSYPFLWVGTPSGIFRYDGGSWKQLFLNDSTEIYEVNCFLLKVFSTYIGTEQGLFVYANDSLQVAPTFIGKKVIGLFKGDNDIYVATRNDGILTLSGKEEILRPEQLPIKEPILADTE